MPITTSETLTNFPLSTSKMSTATEKMLTPSQLEAIPSLTFSNASDLTEGEYSVPFNKKKDIIAQNGFVKHDIWFQTEVC